MVATTKFRMLTDQVASSLNAPDIRVLEVPHPLGGTDEATIRAWAEAGVDTTIALFLNEGTLTTPPPSASSKTVELKIDEVAAALEDVREIIAADGGDIVLESVDAGTARLRLILDSAECRECVMPRSFLEQVALDTMRQTVPELTAVHIDDPRENDGT